MPLRIESAHLDGVVVLVPEVFRDHRGEFIEVFRADDMQRFGLPAQFLQENESRSRRGVLRGLHFQWDPPMGKLMRVTRGRAFLVAVDLRHGSPHLGRVFALEASEEDRRQVWAPAGFARGFCALSDIVEVQYKCTALYNPGGESQIAWNDPDLAIPWPVREPILSEKDRAAQSFAAWLQRPESKAFTF